ncbi:MAG: AMP-binding protein, partial [Planctomycetota bacterium]
MTHEHLAIPNPVHSAALNAPERIGLAHDGGNFTWRELSIIASEWAGALTVAGVKPGDRVALAGQPSAEWVLALHALGWVGAIVVPLPHQADDDELRHVLDISGARRVLTVGDAGETKLSARAVGDRPVWRRDELDPSGPLPERFWPLDEVRVVLLTSGTTTGQPQPVELTTAQLMFAAMGSAIRLGHHTNDRWLCCLPLNYVAGLSIMFRSAWLGITTVLHPQFNAPRVARELASGQVTMVSLVPTMLERVLDACEPGVPFHPALRCILLGGAAAPESLLERCRERRLPVSLTWGLTETAAQVATRNPGELDTRDGVGPPLPFARVDRLPGDPHGDAALQVRGPIAPAGRFRTRDLGHVDAAGCVHLEGRADALIKSGGRAISPAELE